MTSPIGKLIKSNSHTDYVCQIYGPREIDPAPVPADYAFGSFVQIALNTRPASRLVGIIYDTMLLNPEFGRLGPRLSTPGELAVFSPDYLHEKATLIGIKAVGMIDSQGQVDQGVPQLAAMTDAPVEKMSDDQIKIFHGADVALHLTYAPRILSHNIPLATDLLQAVLRRLYGLELQPKHAQIIELMLDHLNWEQQIIPFGGG